MNSMNGFDMENTGMDGVRIYLIFPTIPVPKEANNACTNVYVVSSPRP